MVSTFHGLELGKRGLAVTQANITTTGQNIANANTKGYSRQQVNASASPALDVWTSGGTGQLGTGVTLDSITRVRDRFLDQQYRDQASTLGQAEVKQQTFERLEIAVNEPSDTGLRSAMDQVGSARQDLANDPTSPSAQAVLQQRAQSFVETAQSMDRSMTAITEDLDLQLGETIGEANAYLQQIAELNNSIKRSGSNSNDLLDKRDVLIEELSKLVSIKVSANADGTSNISLRNADGTAGTALIRSGEQVASLSETQTGTGGKLAGIAESLENVGKYQSQLRATVQEFASANGNLFNGNTIAGMSVNGDMTTLTTPATMEQDVKNAHSSFQKLVSSLGAESQASINAVANNEAALQATEGRRQSVTGVSLDEEMANLIMFQHAYSAAARFVSTTDQMLDTIINRMAAR